MRGRMLIALVVAVMSLFGYFGTKQHNPVTGEDQHVSMTSDQEIALGLQAAPEMEAQYGGEANDPQGRALVEAVGNRIVSRSVAHETPYRFQFHLLGDAQTINAFALPGGQVFITEALASKLRTEGELAGVLGHEIGHVVARHSAAHLAKSQLIQGLGTGAVIAAADPNHPNSSRTNQMLAMAVAQMVNLKFGRNDELQADQLGVRLMSQAGYDPRAMAGVMEVLQKSSPGRTPEFFSTHPNPEHRVERIKAAIEEVYPQGVPAGLQR
jgi:predicted Zn-dependent protease